MVLFHERLRTLRQFHDLSVGKLAELTGIPKATLARWDNGETSPNIGNKHLQTLADHFKMSVAELVAGGQ